MKLQIAFDLIDLEKALQIGHEVQEYADVLEVGSLLIYKYGEQAIQSFKEQFPQKVILADAKIVDRGKEVTTILARAGADWVTVMAGTGRAVIHAVCTTAHEQGKKVMLDLLDASSLGQSALEAQSLGVDALLFHKPADEEQLTLLDRWDMVYGNTPLPIFVSAAVNRDTIQRILAMAPHGIVIGKAIFDASSPREEAAFFRTLLPS
jgi:3-hexulose-6-phosphate synthase